MHPVAAVSALRWPVDSNGRPRGEMSAKDVLVMLGTTGTNHPQATRVRSAAYEQLDASEEVHPQQATLDRVVRVCPLAVRVRGERAGLSQISRIHPCICSSTPRN